MSRPDLPCARCGVLMWNSKTSLPAGEATCRPCRAAKRATDCVVCGQPTIGERKTCSDACAHESRIAKKGQKSRARQCEICGRTYVYTYSKQRTCGRACGMQLQGKRRINGIGRHSKVAYLECSECNVWFVDRVARPSTRCTRCRLADLRRSKQRKPRIFIGVQCKCGVFFLTTTKARALVCSPICRRRKTRKAQRLRYGRSDQARKRARRYGVAYEAIDRVKVFERDAWRCGICGKKTSRSKVVPHPKAPTLDHIVPMAVGGDHLYSNVQCAHFECNWRKSTGGTDQLRLVG